MANDIVPYDGAATPEEAVYLFERVERASRIFVRRFWGLAEELYNFATKQAFLHYGANSMSEWLQAGNARVGRSWGMLLIQSHYTYRVRLPEILPEPELANLNYMLGEIKSENLQAIQPTVRRLMARIDGQPVPSDPARDIPITPEAAAAQIVELVNVAHRAATAHETRAGIRKLARFSYRYTIGELPPAVREWWLLHGLPPGLPLDSEFYGYAQEIE